MNEPLNWKEATTSQLLTIAFHEYGAHLDERYEAAAELQRRNKPHYIRENHKLKPVYPK
ncbi:hypothetical protein [Paenibacillus foliorum]|uniref:hypothetical protein n=1 Tax=Paenibacillus foliorum TaxID=2654974 RepID=UPI00149106B7|nr:hypothetical protein [Paenibacillus foliorum]